MTKIPSDLKYAKTHEWVRVAGEVVTVGITDHAQHELTEVVFVELPPLGRKLVSGESCAVVESVKTASDIYSPVGGEVVEVNEKLARDSSLVNTDPYGEGWLWKMKLANPSELGNLMPADDYSKQIHP